MGETQQAVTTARELAEALLPHLQTLANLHYLMNCYIGEPAQLQELRAHEDKVFSQVLEKVRASADC